MFGVPGDFNLGFLVRVLESVAYFDHSFFARILLRTTLPSIGWATGDYSLNPSADCQETNRSSHSNELNAAYAADGYARVKSEALGVVLTTFVPRIVVFYER